MTPPTRSRRLLAALAPSLGCLIALSVVLSANHVQAADPPGGNSPEAQHAGEHFFERKVRPVFVEHCHKCHAGEKQKGGLKIETLQGLLAGGDSGPAIVPGDAEHSLIIQAIHWGDDTVQMPPTKKLPDAIIADLTQWVQMGAPWPGADRRRTGRPGQEASPRNHRRGSAVLGLPTDPPSAHPAGTRRRSEPSSGRCFDSGPTDGKESFGGKENLAQWSGHKARAGSPGILRSDRPAPDAGGSRTRSSTTARPTRWST